jgi:hypothetical protein
MLAPDSIVHSQWFAILAAFVALNTVMYCALAVVETLPRIYLTDWLRPRARRSESRSIHPDHH